MVIHFLLIALMSVPGIAAMELDQELLNLPLSPRDKELAQGPRSRDSVHSPRSLLKTPVSSPRVSSLSSGRRLSLTNLLKGSRNSLQKTFSSPRLERPQDQSPQFPSSPSRKRLSSSSISDLEREKVLIFPPRSIKRQPISGEEDQDNFKMVVFHARNTICTDLLEQKKAELIQAQRVGDQELVKELGVEIQLIDTRVMQFATEQRDWLVDQLLS